MSELLTKDRLLRPELFFTDILRDSALGKNDEAAPFLMRALVVAVDTVGGKLENPDGSGKSQQTIDGKSYDVVATSGPPNPRNSIKARLITDAVDQFLDDDHLRVFWPFFPETDYIPVKPGEYVYVVFEDVHKEHGLWISKVPGQENMNFFPGQKSFVDDPSLTALFGDSKQQDQPNMDTDRAATESSPGDTLSQLLP